MGWRDDLVLRALASLAEDLGLVPSTNESSLQLPEDPVPGDPAPFSGLRMHWVSVQCSYIYVGKIFLYIKNKPLKIIKFSF